MKITQLAFPAIVGILLFFSYSSGLTQYLTLEGIKEHRFLLKQAIASHPFLAPFAFIFTFIVVAISHFPGGAVFMQMAAGFLFPQPLSTIVALFGAVLGGCCVFVMATSSFGEFMRNQVKSYKMGASIDEGLKQNGILYLVILRALLPFWLMNIVPSLFAVNFSTFVWSSVAGLFPRTWMLAEVGKNVAEAVEIQKSEESMSHFINQVLWRRDMVITFAIFAVSLIALIAGKRYMDKRAQKDLKQT